MTSFVRRKNHALSDFTKPYVILVVKVVSPDILFVKYLARRKYHAPSFFTLDRVRVHHVAAGRFYSQERLSGRDSSVVCLCPAG